MTMGRSNCDDFCGCRGTSASLFSPPCTMVDKITTCATIPHSLSWKKIEEIKKCLGNNFHKTWKGDLINTHEILFSFPNFDDLNKTITLFLITQKLSPQQIFVTHMTQKTSDFHRDVENFLRIERLPYPASLAFR